MRFGKSVRYALMSGAVGAAMVISGGAPAHALELDDASATSNAEVVDVWSTAGGTVNALVGPRACTISASAPVVSANQVAGSGSISCSHNYAKLTLTVCVQWKQAFVSEETTWQDAGCAPTKAALNSKFLNSTATAQCQPGPILYRTKSVAEGFNADSSEPVFTGMITSNSRLYDCFL